MNANNYNNIKRAVIYVRVSTKEQVEEGNSLCTQQKICLDYAKRHDYDVTEIFVEQGESAKTADRTELQRLLSFCADRKQAVKAVIIYKLDRLSRNTDDYSQLRLFLKRYGVEIKSTSEHFENSPVGRFMENTMANIAQFDNDIRSERCAGGMKEAMRDGRYVWMAPVGYRNVKIAGRSTIARDEVMAPLILEMFELIASNIYPTEEIRQIMTKKGLTNKQGKPLSKGYFYRMLTNQLFPGWIVKFGERHRGTFTAIVSDELFDQVQRVLKYKGRKHSAHLVNNPDFPLRKFIVNEEGRKLTGSWSQGNRKKYPYYRFGGLKSNHNRDRFELAFMRFMDQFSLNEALVERLKELVQENLVEATIDQSKETERLKKDIAKLTERQNVLIKKNLDGVITDSVLKQQLSLIDRELLEANALLLNQSSDQLDYQENLRLVEDFLINPSEIWKEADINLKTQLQWFEFPQGLTFKNKTFRTREICSLFKAKDAILASLSPKVDLGVGFWNKFAQECQYLQGILKGPENRSGIKSPKVINDNLICNKRVELDEYRNRSP